MKVAIVAHDFLGSREIVTRLVSENPDVEFEIFLTRGLYYRKSLLASIWKLLREASFRFSLYRGFWMLKYRLKGDRLVSRARRWGIRTHVTRDINGAKSNSLMTAFSPDVTFSINTMHIVKEPTLSIPRLGTIGCHPSLIPAYRGLEIFFWVLVNGEDRAGASVFFLTERVDHGQVIAQEDFAISESETLASMYEKENRHCAKLMARVLQDLKSNGSVGSVPTHVTEGESYLRPTQKAYRRFKAPDRKWSKGDYFPMPTGEAYRRFKATGRKWG